MKIALLHYSAPPVVGGVEAVVAEHARRMAGAGHQVRILAGRGEPFDGRVALDVRPRLGSRAAEVLRVKSALDAGAIPPGFERLRAEIRDDLRAGLEGSGLLFAHNVASLHKNLALTAALHDLYREAGFPRLILWHHDLAWKAPRYRAELHDGFPWDLLRARWEGAVHVTVSGQRRRELADLLGLPEASIRVVPNGVDRDTFFKLEPETIRLSAELGLQAAAPLLLLPARLTPRKNVELALRTLAELRRSDPQAMLLVTGPEGPHNPSNAAYRERLLALRDELGLQAAAHFLAGNGVEFLPDRVVSDFYRLADALLFPSREEGFGIPLLEAGFSRLPVFCADLPALRELGGADVSFFDPEEEPRAVARLIHARLDAEATSRWARRARRGFDWGSIYAERIAPLIQEVMA